MKIQEEAWNGIIDGLPVVPPETGGIIGGKDGIVSVFALDKNAYGRGCSYRPNVNYLNSIIEKWHKIGYEFMGLFHVHFFGVKTLSDGDVKYIKRIMCSMPDNVNELYFPLVVQPEKEMVPYLVRRQNGEITIRNEKLTIMIKEEFIP